MLSQIIRVAIRVKHQLNEIHKYINILKLLLEIHAFKSMVC